MKREYYIFLVLIVAAAVITGSTIGIASNFDIIASKTIPAQITTIDNPPTSTENDEAISNIALTTDFNTDLNISEQEQVQIIEMLYILGMVNTSDYNEFIKDFQTQHALTPTGSLDSKTLNLIIEQVKLEQASRSLNNTR